MNIKELFEAVSDPLKGYMDVNSLTSLLPDIDNVSVFTSAMNKIRLGQGSMLTYAEKIQLGLAWVSFVGLDAPHKSIVSSKLMAVQDAAPPSKTAAQQSVTPSY